MQALRRAVPKCHQSRHFRLAANAKEAGLRVFIIRHGQSTNNQLQLQVEEKIRLGDLTAEQATEEWMLKRVPDPALSEKGEQEAAMVAGRLFSEFAGHGAAACSPMLRAIQTANPLVQGSRCPGIVSPLLHEVGGMYEKSGNTFVPAAGLSATEIQARFPSLDVSKLPQAGCWNEMRAKEQPDGFYARANAAAAWVKSKEVRELVAGGPLMLVMHSDFIDLTIKALLCLPVGPPQAVFHTSNCSVTELFLPDSFCAHGEGYGTLVTLNCRKHLEAQ